MHSKKKKLESEDMTTLIFQETTQSSIPQPQNDF